MRLTVIATISMIALLPPPAAAVEATLEEAVELAQSGAPGLALRLLERLQPRVDEDPEGWARHESERLHILSVRGEWRALDARVDSVPGEAPAAFRAWAMTQQARARLELGDGSAARVVLRELIWRPGAPGSEGFDAWRRLVIRSYLVDDRHTEALTALQRYVQDHGHDRPAMRTMHAEVLLRLERPREAHDLLRGTEGESVQAMRALAAMRAERVTPADTFEGMVRLGSDREASQAARKAAWRVAAEAARVLGNPATRVASLERAMMTDPGNRTLPGVLGVEAPELWDAYHGWGRELGNAMHLIVGIDQQWLDAAEASDEPLRARALYATLATDTHTAAVREFAHFRLARLLSGESGGARALVALYLDPRVHPDPADVPERVRYALLDPVLERGDIELASRLVADLETPPEGSDPVEWSLRRARVLVLGGRPDSGARVLDQLLDEYGDGLDEDRVDRLLQVVFDLQAVESHRAALELFERVYAMDVLGRQARRELLYWMADSRLGLGHPDEAARMYLKSATLDDPFAMDQWAQTARFQAAEALTEAGLAEDAAVLLRGLLNATDDPARRAVLRHRIDQLQRLGPGRTR